MRMFTSGLVLVGALTVTADGIPMGVSVEAIGTGIGSGTKGFGGWIRYDVQALEFGQFQEYKLRGEVAVGGWSHGQTEGTIIGIPFLFGPALAIETERWSKIPVNVVFRGGGIAESQRVSYANDGGDWHSTDFGGYLGIGLEFKLTPRLSATLGYMWLFNIDRPTFTVVEATALSASPVKAVLTNSKENTIGSLGLRFNF